MPLQKYTDYIDSYSGRDRIMRVLYYSSQLVAGFTRSNTMAEGLNNISDQIDSCRTVLRLFDDIPMLCYTLSYGLGKEDPDNLTRFCGVTVNLLDHAYYPLEHIAWAADCKLLKLKSQPWWTASTVCWALSVYFMFIKSLRYYMYLKNIRNSLKSVELNLSDGTIQQLRRAQTFELFTASRCLLDLINAINYLPPGILWAGKLRQWHTGILGLASSLISIYLSA